MYKKIMNPLTNKKVNIYSKLGKQIIRNYLRIFNGGGTVKEEALFNTDDIVEIHNLSNDIHPQDLKHVGKLGIILELNKVHRGYNMEIHYIIKLVNTGEQHLIRQNNLRKIFNKGDRVEIHNLSNDISPDNLKHVGKQGIILSLMEAHAGLNSTLYYNVTLPDGSKLDIRPNNVRKVEVDYDSSPIPPVLERERRPYGME